MQIVELHNVTSESLDPEYLGGKNIPDLFRKIFLSAPQALVVLDAAGSILPNTAAKDLLNEVLGPKPPTWQNWISAAATRLLAQGVWQEVVTGLTEGRPELEVTLGPEVSREGHQVLGLRKTAPGESRTEDLASTVSTLYHELRTPLTSMKSSLNLVVNGDTGTLNADQEHFLGMTMRNIERLDRLVGDLLDVSRAATGNLVLNLQEGDLGPVLHESLEQYAETARAAGLGFHAEGVPDFLWAKVDQDKVVQMLTNVLGNAVKYTPAGGEIRVWVEENSPTPGFSVVVSDTGPGMDAAALAQVFEPFKRVHDEHRCRVPGSGLGLHITRGLARAHGGDLELTSEPGVGTTVRLVLPQALAGEKDPIKV